MSKQGTSLRPARSGNDRAAADIDEYAGRSQGSRSNPDRLRPDKFCIALNHLGVFQTLHPLLDTAARLEDDLVLSSLDARHLYLNVAGRESKLGTASGHVNRPRAGHHGFGRDAAHIDTGAAEVAPLDHRRAQAFPGAARSQGRPRLPGPDDDGIKRFDLHTLLQKGDRFQHSASDAAWAQ